MKTTNNNQKYNYNYKCFSNLKLSLIDLYSTVKCFHGSHEDLIKMRNEKIYQNKKYKYLTVFQRGYLMGVDSTLFDGLYKNDLTFCYKINDEIIEGKNLNSEHFKELNKNKDYTGFFVWKNSDNKIF